LTQESPHLLIVAQKANIFDMAIEQQSKIEGGKLAAYIGSKRI